MLSPLNKMTIKRKLTLILMLTSIAALLIAGIMFIILSFYSHRQLHLNKNIVLANVIGRNCQAALKFDIPEDAEKILAAFIVDPSIIYTWIYDTDGKIFAIHRSSELKEQDIITHKPVYIGPKYTGFSLQLSVPITVGDEVIGSIYLQDDQREVYSALRRDVIILLLVMFIAVTTAYIMASILQKFISMPILQLASTARIVSRKKDYSIRAKKQSEDEVGLLIESFNEMLSQIQLQRDQLRSAFKTLRAQKKELEGIIYVSSHDLRTPLVNIQGFSNELKFTCQNIDRLLTKLQGDKETMEKLSDIMNTEIPESIDYICSGANKMDALLDGLLKLSRIGQANLKISKLDMNSLIEEIQKTMQYQINETNIVVTIDDLPACLGDIDRISQVFTNLLDNAIKYLDPKREGKIHISGKVKDQMSIYCVQDNGLGISQQYYEKVFEIFHRLYPDGDAAGEGIGLAIVRRIIDRHNGSIWVESQPGIGSRFYVALPHS